MNFNQSESIANLKRQRRRIRRKRIQILGLSFLTLLLLSLVVLVFTAGQWMPSAVAWLAPRLAPLEVQIGSVDFFPLGQLSLRQVAIRNNQSAQDALSAGQVQVRYARFLQLLRGHLEKMAVEDLRIQNVEAVRLIENLRSDRKPSAKQAPLQKNLARWLPRSASLRKIHFETSAGKEYYLEFLQSSCTLTSTDQLHLTLSLETGPLRDLLPVEVEQPLQMSVLASFTPDAFHLLNIKSNIGSLLRAEAAEPEQVKEGEAVALQMENLRFDLNQWVQILDLPVAGTLEFDMHVPEWRFGRAQLPQVWTGGLGPDAYFSQMRMELHPFQWLDFHPGWSALDGKPEIVLDLSAMPDFSQGWVRADATIPLAQIRTPNGEVDDALVSLQGSGFLQDKTFAWSNQIKAAFPGASLKTPENLRLRIAGQTTGTLRFAKPLQWQMQVAGIPRFERNGHQPFEIPLQGSVEYRKNLENSPESLEFRGTGQLAQGAFELTHGREIGERSLSTATLSLRHISLAELDKGMRVINRNLPIQLRGRLTGNARMDQESSGPLQISGQTEIQSFQPRTWNGRPLLKHPIALQARYALARSAKAKGEWAVSDLRLDADGNFQTSLNGLIQKGDDTLEISLKPALQVRSIARALYATSQTLGPFLTDGNLAARGKIDWRQNAKIARIQYLGDTTLTSASVKHQSENWSASGIKGTIPVSLTWYQDMVRGTKERPVAVLDTAIAPTVIEINRAQVGERRFRWLELMLGLHGRFFLNPEVPGREAHQLMMIEYDQIVAELPDIAKIQGDIQAEWRTARFGQKPARSGQVTLSAQIMDPQALAEMLHLPTADATMKGSISLENGRLRYTDAATTLTGRVDAQAASGEAPNQAISWKDLAAQMNFTLQRHKDFSTVTLQVSGQAKAGQLAMGGIRLSDLIGYVDFQEQSGQVDIQSFRALNGTGEMISMVDMKRWPPTASALVNIYNVDLETFTREFSPGDVALAGKVDVKADLGLDENGKVLFAAQITQASNQILVNKTTVRRLVVEWAQRTGMGFSMGAEEMTLRREYRNVEMIPFDFFEITCRYENSRFINRVVMRNAHFNIVIDSPVDLEVVTEFLRIKQDEIQGRSGF